MRQLIIVGLVSLASLAAGCSSNSNEASEMNASGEGGRALPLYTIAANPVTGDRTAGINGSFQITQMSPPNAGEGITSDLYGGACIVFRAKDLGYTQMAAKSCNIQADCDTGEGQGYCEASTKQCWARPIVAEGQHDPLCNRSIDYVPPKPWAAGTNVPISQSPIPVPAGLQPNAQALAIALLKGKGAGGAGPHSIEKWGNPTTLP